MKKISKITVDKEQEARDREFLNRSIPSPHFTVGTRVSMFRKGSGEILDVCSRERGCVSTDDTVLMVRWEDGTVEFIKPYALNR